MYPEELRKFIQERNYRLGGEDLMKAISPQENPQLDHVLYDAFDNKYKMWDKYGGYYEFQPIFYKDYEKMKKM